mmetsp:Transcript_47420/g.152244  ORF Transcript_47420/g.152244 Transcript_47420/m.152244 type:complete len:347 (+) Transcript_47420:1807-2847(+)
MPPPGEAVAAAPLPASPPPPSGPPGRLPKENELGRPATPGTFRLARNTFTPSGSGFTSNCCGWPGHWPCWLLAPDLNSAIDDDDELPRPSPGHARPADESLLRRKESRNSSPKAVPWMGDFTASDPAAAPLPPGADGWPGAEVAVVVPELEPGAPPVAFIPAAVPADNSCGDCLGLWTASTAPSSWLGLPAPAPGPPSFRGLPGLAAAAWPGRSALAAPPPLVGGGGSETAMMTAVGKTPSAGAVLAFTTLTELTITMPNFGVIGIEAPIAEDAEELPRRLARPESRNEACETERFDVRDLAPSVRNTSMSSSPLPSSSGIPICFFKLRTFSRNSSTSASQSSTCA